MISSHLICFSLKIGIVASFHNLMYLNRYNDFGLNRLRLNSKYSKEVLEVDLSLFRESDELIGDTVLTQ